MSRDATYLTEKYGGRKGEEEVWHPCLEAFFRSHKPTMPVYGITLDPAGERRFRIRGSRSTFTFDGNLAHEPFGGGLAALIESATGEKVTLHPEWVGGGDDDTGFKPDFVHTSAGEISFIEVKPFDHSSFSGSQIAGEANSRLVQRLRRMGIQSEYIIAMPIAAMRGKDGQLLRLQDELGERFGFLFFEDMFIEMASRGFTFERITERWDDYADKPAEYLV
ncbi:MAG: hypothetical protein BroJett031_02610 [Betaproteobacteria bacterium]|nr:MAG: hypothetical protein BroJett031_02610 [Betaproteobacteria bacterium]